MSNKLEEMMDSLGRIDFDKCAPQDVALAMSHLRQWLNQQTGWLPQQVRGLRPQEITFWNDRRTALERVQNTCAQALVEILEEHNGEDPKDLADGTILVGHTNSNGSRLTYHTEKPRLTLPTGSGMQWIRDTETGLYLPQSIANHEDRVQIQFSKGQWWLITRFPQGTVFGEPVDEETLEKVKTLRGSYPYSS